MRNKKLSLFAGSVTLYMENLKLENPKEDTHTHTHRKRQMDKVQQSYRIYDQYI